MSRRTSAQAGVYSDGLMTTRLPAASISTSGPTERSNGKFQGTMFPTTPLGWGMTNALPDPNSAGSACARLGGHPGLQMLGGVAGAAGDAEHLDQVGRGGRVHAEVGAHRLLDLGAVAHDHAGEGAEQLPALIERRVRVGQERRPLALDDLLELGDRGGIVAGGRRGRASVRVIAGLLPRSCAVDDLAGRVGLGP